MSSSDSLTQKPTPRIKYCAVTYHTTEVIAYQKPKSGCHGNVLGARYGQYLDFVGHNIVHNQLPSRCRSQKKQLYSNLSPKIGCRGNVPQHL